MLVTAATALDGGFFGNQYNWYSFDEGMKDIDESLKINSEYGYAIARNMNVIFLQDGNVAPVAAMRILRELHEKAQKATAAKRHTLSEVV